MATSDISLTACSTTSNAAGARCLEYQWVSASKEEAPAADHRLTVVCPASTDPTRFLGAGRGPQIEGARGWPVRWTAEIWPVVLRHCEPVGRRLGVDYMSAGLRLVECGLDVEGEVVIEHRATVRADQFPADRPIDLGSASVHAS
jgi:hypothetical protein